MTLMTETLRAAAESLRQQANLMDALAMANSGGADSDLLKPAEVQQLMNCGRTKACEIVSLYGAGKGRMGRIERGRLVQLQREGKL